MMKIFVSISLILTVFLSSCSTKLPEIEGMNYDAWVTDKYGCRGERMDLVSLIDINQDKFLRYNQNEIIDILGRPENQTLFTRSPVSYTHLTLPTRS